MRRNQQRRLRLESLENRQLLTTFIDGVEGESRDDDDGDLDIYVSNEPGRDASGPAATEVNQLWGDWF